MNRRPLARALPLAAALALLLVPAAGANTAPADAPARATAHKPAKRAPFPAARLWYRVSVDFDGAAWITDRVSGEPNSFNARWRLQGRHAVRLTLLCVNTRLGPSDPFEWRERIRGRKRRVGGCPRPTRTVPRKNLRETVRFAATADGELTTWEHDDPIDFIDGCPGRVEHYQLAQSQGLTGQISSSSSATDGLHLSVNTIQPTASYGTSAPAIKCAPPSPRPPFDKPAIAMNDLPFVFKVFGDESWIGDQLAGEQLAVRFPPQRFGRNFTYTRHLTQAEDRTLTRAPSPAGPHFLDPFGAKDYTYTISFTACPDKGHNVKDC
jgi:hypothetical protein